jgi:flagellar operon protein
MSFRIERNGIIPEAINSKNRKDISNDKFEDILNSTLLKTEKVKISAHAQKRMLERGISLQKKDLENISKAIDNLQTKDAKESLILYRDMAFITSVKNRTIITAIEEKDMDIVTNIDSAVIVK